MKKRPIAHSTFRLLSCILLVSLFAASSFAYKTGAVHAQDAYTATPTSTPISEDTSEPEPVDQPGVATPEPESVVDEQPTRPVRQVTEISQQGQVTETGLPTDRIIVKYKSRTNAFANPMQADVLEQVSSVAGQNLSYLREMSNNSHVLELPERLPLEEVQAISEQLMSLPEVEYAEPDLIMKPFLAPNDPQYGQQWHYWDTWGINAPAAWDITTGSSSIVMAVIDSGITNHADLAGRTVPGYDFISNVWIANDGNKRDSDPSDPGDWVSFGDCGPGAPAESSSWHGTHVAGTMGAASNNNMGVAGVNWNSKILPVRVLGRCGGYTSDIVDGMRWAAGLSVSGVPRNQYPAKVLNLSLGGPGACSTTYQTAINNINTAGGIVVVAAGNSADNANFYTPARCNGVITVAAIARDGYLATYSNAGSTVEISAPGGNLDFNIDTGILSTVNAGTAGPSVDSYDYYQGTSMAAPHVSGVISLMVSINPTLKTAQVLQILQSTARPFRDPNVFPYSCNTSICGAGVIDAGAAVAAVPLAIPGVPALLSPAKAGFAASVLPTFDWKDSNPLADHYAIQVSSNNTFTALAVNEANVSSSNYTPVSNLVAGSLYYWRVKASNEEGGASAWSPVWTFKTPLAQPTLVTPDGGALLTTDRPSFGWNAVPDATQYNIQVSVSNKFGTFLLNATTNAASYTMPKDLPQNKNVFWRVRAKTLAVMGPWSAISSFTTGNPPTVPVLAMPANGALIKDYTPAFNWKDVTIPAGTTFKHYELQVDDNSGFSSPASYTTTPGDRLDSDYTLGSDLPPNTRFYWRVRAVNTDNLTLADHTSGWSKVFSFRTVIPAPTGLTATPGTLQPTFTWNAAAGPGVIKGYTIQVSTNAKFSTLLLNSTSLNTFYEMKKNLPAGKVLHWRVRVNGDNGPSAWTTVQYTTP